MNLHDFDKFFGAVAKAFVVEPGFYEYFIRHGFDPNEWPECPGKTIALEFNGLVNARSLAYAQLYLAKKVEGLNTNPLPSDANGIIAAFSEFKEFGLYRQLGESLMQDPKHGKATLNKFKNNATAGVVVKSFSTEIATYIEKQKLGAEQKTEKVVGINGWPLLSNMIGGFNPSRIILVVAGTGVGKTTFSLNLVLSALSKMPSLYFNMEMAVEDVYDRLCMIGAEIPNYQWNAFNSQATVEKTAKFISTIYNQSELFITDGRALTIEQITSEIFNYKEKHDVKLVIVDYDQKIRTRFGGEEWQQVQQAVEALEEVSKATQTCIIVLAQGDENNLPKASKRSMQAASTVLAFYQDDNGEYIIEAKKNRFGRRNAKLKVQCDFERFTIKEDAEYFPPPPSKKGLYDVDKKK